ncbi:MAG: hypothetical protein LIO81_11410 [Clostridiales bacterium]|nr:hypothetical protein [Clostridiales bacterium]
MKRSTKRLVFMSIFFIFVIMLAGCQAKSVPEKDQESITETERTEEQSEEAVVEPILDSYYLVTNMYGDGQKPWYLVLQYDTDLEPSSVSADDYEIDDYDIKAVYTSPDAVIPEESATGNYVLIEFHTDYTTSNYGGGGSSGSESLRNASPGNNDTFGDGMKPGSGGFEAEEPDSVMPDSGKRGDGNRSDENRSGGNRNGRMAMFSDASPSNQLTVTFRQIGNVSFTNGTALDGWAESFTTDYKDNVNLLVENFSQYTFTLSDGTSLMYSLYLPDNYDESREYPLVLFMPDATGEGSDEYLALTESLGGVIWTTDEWQNKHETIVLVPQYEDSNSENPIYTMELVTDIVSQYSVDTSREYLVGQSSGTIRSIKLLIDYPDEFAGAFLVAGQTDSAYTDSIPKLSTQNIWMLCSEGDARAYPGMTEITDGVNSAGTEVTIAQWSAILADDEQEKLAAEQASAGTSINWTIFDAGTVMRDDVNVSAATEHMNTWRVAYDLDTIREWLFEQTTQK